MSERKTANGLDFEALRHAVERCDPEILLDFYADDASLSILSAEAQRTLPFELYGRGAAQIRPPGVRAQGWTHPCRTVFYAQSKQPRRRITDDV